MSLFDVLKTAQTDMQYIFKIVFWVILRLKCKYMLFEITGKIEKKIFIILLHVCSPNYLNSLHRGHSSGCFWLLVRWCASLCFRFLCLDNACLVVNSAAQKLQLIVNFRFFWKTKKKIVLTFGRKTHVKYIVIKQSWTTFVKQKHIRVRARLQF